MYRHIKQVGVVPTKAKDRGRLSSSEISTHDDRGDRDDGDAFAENIFQLAVVGSAVMIADDWRAADRKAEERSNKDEIHIHHDRMRRYARLADDPHELDIEQDTH